MKTAILRSSTFPNIQHATLMCVGGNIRTDETLNYEFSVFVEGDFQQEILAQGALTLESSHSEHLGGLYSNLAILAGLISSSCKGQFQYETTRLGLKPTL